MSWYLNCLKNYATFDGRARRTEYWMFTFFNLIFMFLAIILDNLFKTTLAGSYYGFFYCIYALAVFLPSLAVIVRRLHDVEKSGAYIFISLIPIVGGIWLFVLECTEGTFGENEFGEDPKAEENGSDNENCQYGIFPDGSLYSGSMRSNDNDRYVQRYDAQSAGSNSQQTQTQQNPGIRREETVQPKNPELKSMFVRNFYPGLPIQAVTLQLVSKDKNTVFARMDFYRYNESVFSAVSVDIEFTTVFGDVIVFRDIPYTNITNFGVILHAGEQPLPLDIYKVTSIISVEVHIKKYIVNDKIVDNLIQSKVTALPEKELSDLKHLEGINAVCLRKDTSEGWICICGIENEASVTECSFCRRPKGDSTDLVGGMLSLLIDKLESCKNAREIKDYLVEYNLKYKSEYLEEIISGLMDTVQTERMYGNQKQIALKKVKEKLLQA